MAEGGGEKSFLGQFVRNQTKYGATRKMNTPNETYINHTVQKGDTVQGIALAYGVSVEQIKRINKLWTNESLCLRDILQIPSTSIPQSASLGSVLNEDGDINCGASSAQTLNENHENGTNKTVRPLTKSKSEHSSLRTDPLSPMAAASGDINARDLLSQYDTSLARMKSNVEKMMCNTDFAMEDPTNPLSLLPSKKNKYGPKHRSKTLDLLNPATSPELQIRSPRNSKRLVYSHQRMEEKDTELFEL